MCYAGLKNLLSHVIPNNLLLVNDVRSLLSVCANEVIVAGFNKLEMF